MRNGLSAATVSREVKRARQFFRAAMRRRLISENPFADLPAPAQANASREHFVTQEVITKVIDACPDAEWRLIVALSRYGGLRCPSEHLSLRRSDIDWEGQRITVRSPKTEHHIGGQSRVIPLFPELRPYLEAVLAEESVGDHLITRYRDQNANLRTQLLRIIKRAGVEPWPKLFHNLRASRQTELTSSFPLHVVCEWIGNSAPIADKHYLQVTEAHFAQAAKETATNLGGAESGAPAAQNRAQQVSAGDRQSSHSDTPDTKKAPKRQGVMPIGALLCEPMRMAAIDNIVPPRGVEPLFSD
ncbi:MAG: tyrosine-type recombinase/integrase [Planctomycetes bacterium]|nr:tyrosine-type recombinase/integrase [Planctomycetota bacterium]